MNDQQAFELVARLVIETDGWSDDKIAATTERLMRLNDPQAASVAVEQVIESWEGYGRPPWSTIRTAYNSAVRHKTMMQPRTELPAGRTVTFSEGRQIAARAYARECASRDDDDIHIRSGFRTNEPNMDTFDRMLGLEPDGF